MPNAFAQMMLLIWPFITLMMLRQLSPERGVILTLLVAYLLLPPPPAGFDFPAMPVFSKDTIPSIATFALVLMMHGVRGTILPQSWIGKGLLFVFVLSPFLTMLNNQDPIILGAASVPGLRVSDALALVLTQAIFVLPFLLARQFLHSAESLRALVVAFMFAGLVYTIPMLIEVRLSPQLNVKIYGYFQHEFGQSIRFGGFRPVVFLYHGIWVAFFCMTALICAAALYRFDDRRSKTFYFWCTVYIGVVLVLAKSLGAWLFAAFLLPLVLMMRPMAQVRLAALLGCIAVAYPVLKGNEIIPDASLLSAARAIDAERAASLEFRFENEAQLLEKAEEKPVFGWGSWGRNHILHPVTGQILSISDGRWVIVIGIFGWVGFLAEFLLLLMPLLLIWREATARRLDAVSPFVGPLSLLHAINMIDLVPNATITPLTFLVAGALLGYAEHLKAERLAQPLHKSFHLNWKPVL
ncbi:hypothetical protein [Pseudaestuariivita sp.]|uniref:hypothetical protein n=1 Tax=Pseudaestuariivita sp. TaxID=2211669 RepID=UPI004058F91E